MMPTLLLARLNAARAFDILNVAAIRGAGRATRGLFSWRLQPQVLLIVACICRRPAPDRDQQRGPRARRR